MIFWSVRGYGKLQKVRGKIREKSGNFEVDDKWQPWFHIAFHYFSPVIMVWLKCCWKGLELYSHPSIHWLYVEVSTCQVHWHDSHLQVGLPSGHLVPKKMSYQHAISSGVNFYRKEFAPIPLPLDLIFWRVCPPGKQTGSHKNCLPWKTWQNKMVPIHFKQENFSSRKPLAIRQKMSKQLHLNFMCLVGSDKKDNFFMVVFSHLYIYKIGSLLI